MSFSFLSSPQPGEIPLLFLPGWGFDARLIQLYNLFPEELLLVPDSFLDPKTFQDELYFFMDKVGCKKVKIAGWSMGAQLGLDFCLSSPDRVVGLDLIAMRKKWPSKEVNGIRQGIENDLKEYMRGFYRKCFLGYKTAYARFRNMLQEDYLSLLSHDLLFSGLDYLENFIPPAQAPEGVPLNILHGKKDVIAPVEERIFFPGVDCDIFPHGGHMVLLDKEYVLHKKGTIAKGDSFQCR